MKSLVFLSILLCAGAFGQSKVLKPQTEPISLVKKSPLEANALGLTNGGQFGGSFGLTGSAILEDGNTEFNLNYGLLAGYFKGSPTLLIDAPIEITGAGNTEGMRVFAVFTPIQYNMTPLFQEKAFMSGGTGIGVKSPGFKAKTTFNYTQFKDLVNTQLLNDEGKPLQLSKSSLDLELQKVIGNRFKVLGSVELGKISQFNKTMEVSVMKEADKKSRFTQLGAEVDFKASRRVTFIAIYNYTKLNYMSGAINSTEWLDNKSDLVNYKTSNSYAGVGVRVTLE